MDIVKFWKDQIDIWNNGNKCGFCFEFSAPLFLSSLNTTQLDNPCCVQVFLIEPKFRETKNYLDNGLFKNKTCVWNFSIYVMISESDLGINNYNEIKGHPISESKWENIYKPLIDCLGCDNILDTCLILGKQIRVVQNGDAVLVNQNFQDMNYNGWKINYTFTEIV